MSHEQHSESRDHWFGFLLLTAFIGTIMIVVCGFVDGNSKSTLVQFSRLIVKIVGRPLGVSLVYLSFYQARRFLGKPPNSPTLKTYIGAGILSAITLGLGLYNPRLIELVGWALAAWIALYFEYLAAPPQTAPIVDRDDLSKTPVTQFSTANKPISPPPSPPPDPKP